MRFAIFVALLVASSIFAVHAGVLDARSEGTTAEGTLLVATWSQGCSTFSLGPNQCHPTSQPLYCPLASTGSTSLQADCGGCGCTYGSGTHCPTGEGPCQACGLTCNDVCSPGWTSCSFDYADECSTTNVVCNYEPELIGYGYRNNCEHMEGRHVHGVPDGSGTYTDCTVDTRVCTNQRLSLPSSDFMGSVFDLCPEGYTDEYGQFKTPPGSATSGLVWFVYIARTPPNCVDNECFEDDPDPEPDPDPSDCASNEDCTHVARTDYLCRGSYPDTVSDKNVYVGECQGGYCQAVTSITESDSVDCNDGWRATACAGFPQACVTDSRRCAC